MRQLPVRELRGPLVDFLLLCAELEVHNVSILAIAIAA
jgi:hypothetical protein